ncbi:MAG: hypothetical protein GPJ54_20710 [Candidatus Heimdallarchaeota archaeon]|nr:hypothetical protein [Candidatus Heimdallarchaeota archaeon]
MTITKSENINYYNFPPQVSHTFLKRLNFIVWCAAGLNLSRMAINWYQNYDILAAIFSIFLALVISLPVSLSIFKKVVKKTKERIDELPEKSWVLTFQSTTGYIMILFMTILGYLLRVHSEMSDLSLAFIYNIISFKLILSSLFFIMSTE